MRAEESYWLQKFYPFQRKRLNLAEQFDSQHFPSVSTYRVEESDSRENFIRTKGDSSIKTALSILEITVFPSSQAHHRCLFYRSSA
jgi:hypothetical protein